MDRYTEKTLMKTLTRLYSADDGDLTCNEALYAIAGLKRFEESSEMVQVASALKARQPQLANHLGSCPDCLAEFVIYQELSLDSTQSEANLIKAPKRPNRSTMIESFQNFIDKLIPFPGFNPIPSMVTRGNQFDLDEVRVVLNDTLAIDIDPAENKEDRQKRDLFLTLVFINDNNQFSFEGVSATLETADQLSTISTVNFDQFGEAVLSGLEPEKTFNLTLLIPNQSIQVQGIIVSQ